jgi:hypothetical protein
VFICILFLWWLNIVFIQNEILKPLEKVFQIDQEIKRKNHSFKEQIAKLQNMMYKATVNCNLFPTNCFSNQDCQSRCSNDTDAYICSSKNLCVPIRGETPVTEGKCNPKHGILALLLADTHMHVANWKCLSLYGEYFQDDNTVSKGVCDNGGVLNVDINLKSPSIVDCKCPADYTLISLKNTDAGSIWGSSTEIPRCIKHKFLYSPHDLIDIDIS